MKFDKNTVIGFVLLAILFGGLFYFNNKQQKEYADYQQKIKDSTDKAAQKKQASFDTSAAGKLAKVNDSLAKVKQFGGLANVVNASEQLTVVENDLVKITFTNLGGRVKQVALKKFNNHDSTPVVLGTATDKIGYKINIDSKNSAVTHDLAFTLVKNEKDANGNQVITYSLADSTQTSPVTHQFVVKPNSYMIDWNIAFNNLNNTLTNNQLNFVWETQTTQHERVAKYEKQQVSNICFYEGNEFDYISSKLNHKFEKPTNWVSTVQQFFNTTLVAKNNFTTGEVKWERTAEDTNKTLAKIYTNFQTTLPSGNQAVFPMQLYYGPNDYKILKEQTPPEMARIINFGRDIYSFVRPINTYIILPIFNFLASFLSNYGWVILLLTVIIRLITAPLMYGSYLSGAKMKALRPELDALKAKFGDNQQGFAMEQMKLYREAGVNPLGGCIPALLQIPIFFALYSFFNSAIALRGQPFLWSKDLSSYDAVLNWSFNIPAIGSHISLFTITAILTSFLISIYNMSNTPTQDNPALKYMPYIFPFILFFVFNNLPSALTWYYTVSNTITLLLQYVIQNYIINHDKILATIEAKRKAPKVKSKWQERFEQMQESQKKIQELKNKQNK